MMRSALLFLICANFTLAAEWETMPGGSRSIGNGLSASRDAAFPSWQYLPRETRSAGADFAYGAWHEKSTTLRLGFFGMIELESDNDDADAVPFSEHTVYLWRGLFGFSGMLSFDRLGQSAFGEGGKIEVGLSARHESEHGTDYFFYDGGPPHIGDFFMPEAAVRIPYGKASFDVRIQDKVFVGGATDLSYDHGPGAELIARLKIWKGVHPFMSHYWEYLIGTREAWGNNLIRKTPDNQYYRNLVGVVLPGKFADLALYTAMMAGNQKGQLVFREQFTWGWGFRVVLFGSE